MHSRTSTIKTKNGYTEVRIREERKLWKTMISHILKEYATERARVRESVEPDS